MASYVLSCSVQPSTGEQCPDGEGVWVTQESLQYVMIRDVLFAAPPLGDAAVVMGVATTMTILLSLPGIVGKLIQNVFKASGI